MYSIPVVKIPCFLTYVTLQVVYDDLVLYVSANTEDERKGWVEAIQDGMLIDHFTVVYSFTVGNPVIYSKLKPLSAIHHI